MCADATGTRSGPMSGDHASEPLFNAMCCDHLHGCGQDERHWHSCCGHWHGRPPIEPLFNAAEFYVTNGTLGPVLWCPECRHQIGYLTESVALGAFLAAADEHARTEHGN